MSIHRVRWGSARRATREPGSRSPAIPGARYLVPAGRQVTSMVHRGVSALQTWDHRSMTATVLLDEKVFVTYSQAFVHSMTQETSGTFDFDYERPWQGQANGLCGAAEAGSLYLVTGTHRSCPLQDRAASGRAARRRRLGRDRRSVVLADVRRGHVRRVRRPGPVPVGSAPGALPRALLRTRHGARRGDGGTGRRVPAAVLAGRARSGPHRLADG